ncbi:hypothetical protein GCM10027565_33000 [Bordetella tumulicola]
MMHPTTGTATDAQPKVWLAIGISSSDKRPKYAKLVHSVIKRSNTHAAPTPAKPTNAAININKRTRRSVVKSPNRDVPGVRVGDKEARGAIGQTQG